MNSTASAEGGRQTKVEKWLSGFGDVTRGGKIVRASREFRGCRLRSIEVQRGTGIWCDGVQESVNGEAMLSVSESDFPSTEREATTS